MASNNTKYVSRHLYSLFSKVDIRGSHSSSSSSSSSPTPPCHSSIAWRISSCSSLVAQTDSPCSRRTSYWPSRWQSSWPQKWGVAAIHITRYSGTFLSSIRQKIDMVVSGNPLTTASNRGLISLTCSKFDGAAAGGPDGGPQRRPQSCPFSGTQTR